MNNPSGVNSLAKTKVTVPMALLFSPNLDFSMKTLPAGVCNARSSTDFFSGAKTNSPALKTPPLIMVNEGFNVLIRLVKTIHE
jgi:hypothetical protein